MSTPSSTDDVFHSSIGQDVIIYVISLLIETIFLTIYGVLVNKVVRILFKKGRSKLAIWTGSAIVAMFLLACALWIIDIRMLIAEMQMTLLNTSSDVSLETKYLESLNHSYKLLSVINILYAYMSVIGDAIIVSRVYAFWSKRNERLVLLIPSAFLFASIISALLLTYCVAHLGSSIVLGTFTSPAFCRNIQTTSYASVLATTAVSTVLIGYKTWTYRRDIRETLRGSAAHAPGRSRTQDIMVIIIESGFLYMLFFTAQIIISVPSVNSQLATHVGLRFSTTVYSYISSIIVGMYPTILILLVHSQFAPSQSSSTVSNQGLQLSSRNNAFPPSNSSFNARRLSHIQKARFDDSDSTSEERGRGGHILDIPRDPKAPLMVHQPYTEMEIKVVTTVDTAV